MNKKKADERILKLCAELITEARKVSGMKKTGNLKKPHGLIIFIFGENGNAVIRTGKIDPVEIMSFLADQCGGVVVGPVTATSPPTKLKSNYIN